MCIVQIKARQVYKKNIKSQVISKSHQNNLGTEIAFRVFNKQCKKIYKGKEKVIPLTRTLIDV
jgi:hypothetical protein